MAESIKLQLVDDHEIFLEGLINLLNEDWIEITGTAENGKEALDIVNENPPDILITDLSMPEMSGVELVKVLKEEYPEVKVLVLTMHNDRPTISEIVMAEAEGYLLKNSSKKELIKAIKRIIEGGTYYANEVMEVILERVQTQLRKQEVSIRLTDRELEILQLIGEEKTSGEIADILSISQRTVETHRKHLLKKTNKRTVVGLLKYSYQAGLLDWK